jgi:microcystin-dependent protein
MNNINFLAKPNFPFASETPDLMQQMIALAAKTAFIAGENYILTGCTDDGAGNVSDGVVVIAGELLPLEGGQVRQYIVVQQNSDNLSAFGESYPDAQTHRKAIFADAGTLAWANFSRVVTNSELKAMIQNFESEPPGFVKMWAGPPDTLETGHYMICMGQLLNRTDYPELAVALGVPDGQTAFNIPDLRGKFVVGYNANVADYDQTGKTGGLEKVALAVTEMPKHRHVYTDRYLATGKFSSVEDGFPAEHGEEDDDANGSGTGVGKTYYTTAAGGTDSLALNYAGSHENRPPYYTLVYVIRIH